MLQLQYIWTHGKILLKTEERDKEVLQMQQDRTPHKKLQIRIENKEQKCVGGFR